MENSILIAEIKRGNDKLLAKLYTEHRNSFISYALNKYQIDIEILKEIYQDAVLAFRNNIIDGKLTVLTCKPRTYLFEICNHLIGKELRKRKHEVRFPDYLENTHIDDSQNLFSKMELNEVQQFVRNELKRLGDKCFQVLYKFYYEKKSMEIIANELNYSNVDSAKSTKHNCFVKLRESIKKNIVKMDLL